MGVLVFLALCGLVWALIPFGRSMFPLCPRESRRQNSGIGAGEFDSRSYSGRQELGYRLPESGRSERFHEGLLSAGVLSQRQEGLRGEVLAPS